jgi:LysM repeat protein
MPKNYTINRGDTLSRIAQQNGTTVADLLKLNPTVTDPNRIYAGASLFLPDAPGATSAAPAAPAAPAGAAPSAGTATAGPNYGDIAKNAGAAGVGLNDLQGLFGPTPEEQKAARDEIAKQFGYDSEDAFMAEAFKKPSKTTEDFYQSAYDAAGLPTILSGITTKKDALSRAIGVVNDNPWYDEAFRRGEASRLQDLAGRDIDNLLDEYNLKHGHVKELVGRYSTDIGDEEKIRTARLNYLESAAKQRVSGKGASRALEYIPQYVEGKKAATPPEKPQTVSVPGTSDLYQYNPATGAFELVRAGRAPVRGGSGSGSGSGSTSDEKKVIAAFNKAIANRAALNRAGTREQFIRELQAEYVDIDPNDIARKVYETYPDNYGK